VKNPATDKPTHLKPGMGGERKIPSGGQYRPRTGNSSGERKPKRTKQTRKVAYVPPVVTPKWARAK